ncbi:MAG TPA: cell division protein SepF [Solirubrobacterales bacterium]|jgi:cell division inhibitor SepF|nr:cell division protein SepF [Solirubrobacterales bacterium]
MAVKDTWHRTLVYFGLAEDDHEYYDDEVDFEPEAELEDRYAERPNVRRINSRRKRDDFDDIFAEDVGDTPTRNLRAVGSKNSGRMHFSAPQSFNEAQQIADKFKDQIPVIINLQETETDLAKRLIDFASGLTYAMDGGMQRIADKTFLLTPRNVTFSAEERARLMERGFFNQA